MSKVYKVSNGFRPFVLLDTFDFRGVLMWNKLRATSHATNLAFPNGNTPFQIMTRLLEECGELASRSITLRVAG